MNTEKQVSHQAHNAQDKCELSSFIFLALLKFIEQSDRVQIFLITNNTFLKIQAKYENKENPVSMATKIVHTLAH